MACSKTNVLADSTLPISKIVFFCQALSIRDPGDNKKEFMLDILVPLVTSETEIYGQLKHDVFGDSDT